MLETLAVSSLLLLSAVGGDALAFPPRSEAVLNSTTPSSSLVGRLASYVDPLIGTQGAIRPYSLGSGNSFPGAAVPFGVVKIGPDMSALNLSSPGIASANSGYLPIGNITGFSMMHTSGTGGQPKYGVVSQMPISGSIEGINLADNRTYWQNRSTETSTAGYYSTKLLSEVEVELTSTAHAGIMRYTFPSSSEAHVLVDLTHVLPSAGSGGISQKYIKSSMNVSSDGTEYRGSGTYAAGWNQADPWTIYFCASFSEAPAASQSFQFPYTPFLLPSAPVLKPYLVSDANYGLGLGHLFSFNGTSASALNSTSASPFTLESRIGISFMNASHACAHRDIELPLSTSFEEVVEASRQQWEDEILSTVIVNDELGQRNETLWRMLYTSLYFTAMMPSDRTGENPLWESNVPYYDDWYTMWDIFRSLTSLYHLIFTDRYVGMLQSIVDVWKNEGFLPDGRSSNFNGRVQGGSDADCVLADAYIRGLSKDSRIDWCESFEAMRTNAEVTPVHNIDFNARDGGTKEGRNGLPDWKDKGYVSIDYTRSVSKTVEYAQNDFGLYVVAKGLGKNEEAEKYLARSNNWVNLWSDNATTTLPHLANETFSGFLAPRYPNGSWSLDFDPVNCGDCSWDALTYEALIWEMTLNIPHDTAALISRVGGDYEFLRRLDAGWQPGFKTDVGAANTAGNMLINPGNEPSFLTSYLYSYVPGHMYQTVNQTRSLIDQFYDDSVSGVPGNGDAGAMQGWLVWALLGLYPVSSQPVMLLSTPFFESIDVRLGTAEGAVLKLRAPGLNTTHYYPQKITLNGRVLDTSWFHSDEITYGGEIIWELGDQPAFWDVGERPPSVSTGGFTL